MAKCGPREQVRGGEMKRGRNESQYKNVSPLSGPPWGYRTFWEAAWYGPRAGLSLRRKKEAFPRACIRQWSRTAQTGLQLLPFPGRWVSSLLCPIFWHLKKRPGARNERYTEQAWGEALCIAPAWNMVRLCIERDTRWWLKSKTGEARGLEMCIGSLHINYLSSEVTSQILNDDNN